MQDILDKIQGTTLFNDSTYYYNITIGLTGHTFITNDESRAFGFAEYVGDRGVTIDGERVVTILALGNQFPSAIIRDFVKHKTFDEKRLKEYTMFTIGDIYLLTDEHIYVAINGDLTKGLRKDGFHTTRGMK